MATVHFGRTATCSTIEVETFTPICSHPDVDPSAPLTLDVPVPVFSLPVPPNECACFSFTSSTVPTSVVTDCGRQSSASAYVEIAPLDADCCTGRYRITPHVEIPCMPFDIAPATTTVSNKSGSAARGIDGSASLVIEKGSCCELTSHLEIVLPDCIKRYDKMEDGNQISFFDRGTARAERILEMVEDPETCSVYPVFLPLELPSCSLADASSSGRFATDAYGGYVDWSLSRTNCDYALSFNTRLPDCTLPDFVRSGTIVCGTGGNSIAWTLSKEQDACAYTLSFLPTWRDCLIDNKVFSGSSPLTNHGGAITWDFRLTDCTPSLAITVDPAVIDIPAPPVFCLADTSQTITVKYRLDTDPEGEYKEAEGTSDVSGGTDLQTGCCKYTFGDMELNLGEIKTGAFGNVGDVFKEPTASGGGGGSGTSGSLYIDGAPGDPYSTKTWYGGGYGNTEDNDRYGYTYSRGPWMRHENLDASHPFYNLAIPSVSLGEGNGPRLVSDGDEQTEAARTSIVWKSARTANGARAFDEDAASGNLSLVVPSGLQWHDRGVAVTMSNLLFNPSGILSEETEQCDLVLLAPAPATTLAQETGGVGSCENGCEIPAGKNGSGLATHPIGGYTSRVTTGLSVKNGYGLRIYNIGDGLTELDDMDDADDAENRQGALEIQYGNGLRIFTGTTTSGETTTRNYLSKPSQAEGALEINYGRGISVYATSGNERTGKVELRSGSDDFMFYSPTEESNPQTTDNKKAREESAELRINDQICKDRNNAEKVDILNTHHEYVSSEGAGSVHEMKQGKNQIWERDLGLATGDGSHGGKSEIIIPIACPVEDVENDHMATGELVRAYLRILRNGTILGIYTRTDQDYPRTIHPAFTRTSRAHIVGPEPT